MQFSLPCGIIWCPEVRNQGTFPLPALFTEAETGWCSVYPISCKIHCSHWGTHPRSRTVLYPGKKSENNDAAQAANPTICSFQSQGFRSLQKLSFAPIEMSWGGGGEKKKKAINFRGRQDVEKAVPKKRCFLCSTEIQSSPRASAVTREPQHLHSPARSNSG